MIGAFRSGILFLLAAPFSVFGAVATLAVRALSPDARRRWGVSPRDEADAVARLSEQDMIAIAASDRFPAAVTSP